MMTTGPFSMAAGDSQWIMAAVLPSEKNNGVDAVNRMRTNAQYLRSLPYDSLITRKARRNVPIKSLPTFNSPAAFKLYSSYPNPFNSGTTIKFDLPEVSIVRVDLFDALGRSVGFIGDQLLGIGTQIVRWSPTVSSGVYFVRVKAASTQSPAQWNGVNKIVLLR